MTPNAVSIPHVLPAFEDRRHTPVVSTVLCQYMHTRRPNFVPDVRSSCIPLSLPIAFRAVTYRQLTQSSLSKVNSPMVLTRIRTSSRETAMTSHQWPSFFA
jgi:hypothetical protein